MTHTHPFNPSTNKNRSIFLIISLVFLFLLSFNGVSIFSVRIPSLGTTLRSPERPVRRARNLIDVSSSSSPLTRAEKEETLTLTEVSLSKPQLKLQSLSQPPSGTGDGVGDGDGESTEFLNPDFISVPYSGVNVNPETYLPHLRKSHSFEIETENISENRNKKLLKMLTGGRFSGRRGVDFPARAKEFFGKKNETSSSCHVRFFMTWISSLNSFNERAFHSIESIFKTHPTACLLIASNSLDSTKGRQILKPFTDKGFRVTAISPDFNFLCKKTMAESWFSRLIRGHVHTGIIPLGQNISNLLRLCLLYKYGGIYIDTDVIILKSFTKLKNSIGAQSVDQNSKNWSRLNNAVMVFDKMHPLVYKFIEEFALTFNGNKWGHNGPYLVSRVVSRLQGRPGYNFSVLPPMAFYPVNWDRVRAVFRGPKNETEMRRLKVRFEQIRKQSYALHLWNKQSRGFEIEEGSIIRKILLDHCVFCNISSSDYVAAATAED